ncbi:MAG: RNA pyrophosphohydrolase [Legionellales bacterium]|nr:RNA pyrophosphohydrolase [Legionellales bacterium]
MIDKSGFRPNVGIIIVNQQGNVFWGRRVGQNAWQFPQGGISADETPAQAMFRELFEEVGLMPEDVKILAVTPRWLRYRLPAPLIRQHVSPVCIGQKQKWFLLQLVSDDSRIDLNQSIKPEFDTWRWVSYWYPMQQVINFKRRVYEKALRYFAPIHNKHRIRT